MCGIFLSITVREPIYPGEALLSVLERRGPDHSQSIERRISASNTSPPVHMVFHSTVLALRGNAVTPQPITSEDDGSVLGWNGEAWSVNGETIEANDTAVVFRGLINSRKVGTQTHEVSSPVTIQQYIASIAGPFAFVFYDAATKTLYFGRDATGRRSLVFREDANSFILCSCSDPSNKDGWQELQPTGIYSINLPSAMNCDMPSQVMKRSELQTWHQIAGLSLSAGGRHCVQTIPRINESLKWNTETDTIIAQNVECLKNRLTKSLHLRLRDIPSWKQTPSTSATPGITASDHIPAERIAILFSGGLDCTVLSRLSHDLMPPDQPIALLNVAFENPRLAKKEALHLSQYEQCPDRITGRSALKELEKTCPGRQWLFVAVNIAYEEFVSHRDTVITLMQPHNTEMDLSIAMALYFASRGTGHVESLTGFQVHHTKAQVLLSGLGADELFGGYLRHENAFKRGGLEALVSELQLDISRIGTRNLGRDDRVTAHWAREVRYPFLDEHFVDWVVKLPVWQKCRFGTTTGLDDVEAAKYLLRVLAVRLGLSKTAREKKRAIQFGTRSAKMFSRKAKGTEAIDIA